MSPLQRLLARPRNGQPRLVLVGAPDFDLDSLRGLLERTGFGPPTVVGPGGIVPADDPRLQTVAVRLRERWPERVRDGIHALDLASDPLLFAAGLVLSGEADVLLALPGVSPDRLEETYRWLLGADRATRGRGALRYLETTDGRLLTTVVPDTAGPLDARGLAHLALSAAAHRQRAVGDAPSVAFLVPPPTRDASHADAEMALAEFRAGAPGLAATVAWDWAEGVEAGPRFPPRPNVLIFPDPVSGHLAHGLLRDAAAARTLGPLFPEGRWAVAGLEGSQHDDIVAVAAVAAAGLRGG